MNIFVAVFVAVWAVLAVIWWRSETRKRERERRARIMDMLQWRVQDRDRAVATGLLMRQGGNYPHLDPGLYDSTWEYAEAVRRECGLNRPWVDFDTAEGTVEIDGVRHRIARLAFEGFTMPVLHCSRDTMLRSYEPGAETVTCLACLAKED